MKILRGYEVSQRWISSVRVIFIRLFAQDEGCRSVCEYLLKRISFIDLALIFKESFEIMVNKAVFLNF